MTFSKKDLQLYAVTNRKDFDVSTLLVKIEQAILGGVTMIQLREKNITEEELKKEAIQVQAICKKHQVPFILNDNVALAKEIDADGVHIGQSDMDLRSARRILGTDKIIGVSARTIEAAQLAEKNGATYLGVGAAFPTGTKSDAEHISHERLKAVCNSVSIPAVAIGGISEENAKLLTGTGIAGIAVVSAIFAKDDAKKAAKHLNALAKEVIQ